MKWGKFSRSIVTGHRGNDDNSIIKTKPRARRRENIDKKFNDIPTNPITAKAYEILHTNEIYTVPGLLANAGGIIAAYVELTADVSLEDNIKNHTKTKLAKQTTIERIADNIRKMDAILNTNKNMRSDQVALYMTYRNLYADQ